MPSSRVDESLFTRRVTHVIVVVIAMAMAALLTGCTLPTPDSHSETATSTNVAAEQAEPVLTVSPQDGATDVSIIGEVFAEVAGGTIVEAVLTNDAGKTIEGVIAPDGSSWKPAIPLGYGRTYTLEISYAGQDSAPSSETRSFSMATPQSIVTPTLASSGGGALESNREYGVGIVVAARFDQPVIDRAAMEKLMTVTTTPELTGNWYWLNSTVAHWRPEEYYPTGTEVTVDIATYGKELGGGQYGGDDAHVEFRISDQRRVAIADDNTKMITVYHDQQPVRTMPTSMGQGGYANYNGVSMHFWTQTGRYTVLDKAPMVTMDSSTYGLPVNSALGYREQIANAVRISTDGIYLHELASSMWAQGNTNVSHGCLNLAPNNAQWYYNQAVAGDPVEVINTDGPPLEVWQNGDWSVPWSEWQTGAADD